MNKNYENQTFEKLGVSPSWLCSGDFLGLPFDGIKDDKYLAMLGHELRNPLAAIANATELLKLIETDNSEFDEIKEVLERQTTCLRGLVDGLLDMSRISRGKLHLDMKPINACGLLEDIISGYIRRARKKNISLRFHVPSDPLWIRGDRTRLTQSLENLFDNAFKFTPEYGTIEIRTYREQGEVLIDIIDTGVGIEPSLLPEIFEPFTQCDQSIDRAQGGLGLGLPIALGIVSLHDGTLRASSEGPGQGSHFQVSLPYFDYSPEYSTPEERAFALKSKQILVVEDNIDAARLLERVLMKYGQEVRIVHNGEDAIESIKNQKPDLVLCDIGLPGKLNGYDVARVVRSHKSYQSTPMIAVTGYGMKEDIEKAISSGFDQHITKPLDFSKLKILLQEMN